MAHRRVVRLSDVDRRRLEAGEISDPTQALHEPENSGRHDAGAEPDRGAPRSENDERLRRDIPPHWGG